MKLTFFTPPPQPALSTGEIHIWRFAIPAEGVTFASVLSPAELTRATNFGSDAARTQYLAARAAARSILSRYIGIDPQAVAFEIQPGGKPQLARQHRSALAFNGSDSNAFGLLAVGLTELGIDLELKRERARIEAVMQRVSAESEWLWWQALPAEQKLDAFYRLWTVKEAALKAIGCGLACPPRIVQPALPLAGGPVTVDLNSGRQMLAYQLFEFDDYVFTLVTPNPVDQGRLSFFTWQG